MKSGATRTFRCNACKDKKRQEQFDEHVFDNARKYGRKRVCTACQNKGFSVKDCDTYYCSNGCARGHLDFETKALENNKARRTPMLCKTCRDNPKQKETADANRAKDLLKRLRSSDAWKCTCKKLRAGQRARAALNEMHTEKCLLAPTFAGEHRWDGKNKGVTLEDLRFMSARKDNKW